MGLYICKRAAEALGARVWLQASGPDGSTFCAWIPLDPVVDPTPVEGLRLVGSRG